MDDFGTAVLTIIFMVALGFAGYGCQWGMHSWLETEDNSRLMEKERRTGVIRDKYAEDGRFYVYIGTNQFEVSEEDYNKVDEGDAVEVVTKYWIRDNLNSMFDSTEDDFHVIEQVFKLEASP